jgi:hypothetical protein
MRDDFTKDTKDRLAKRAGMRCSNPDCRSQTAGPDSLDGTINIGEAAHITGASPSGARYDASLLPEQRQSIENGIWLCRRCAKIVDADEIGHPKSTLLEWKAVAEHIAALEVRGFSVSRARPYSKLDTMMPELIDEMRKDLKEHPLWREFILLRRSMVYNASKPDFFTYFYDDHQSLDSKAQILTNYGASVDITFNSVKRYNFTEEFVEHLLKS